MNIQSTELKNLRINSITSQQQILSIGISRPTPEAPKTQYVRNGQIRELILDGEFEPDLRDAFVASQAGTGIPILEAKNLKSLTEPSLQLQLREAAESREPVKLDLGAGEREYDVRADKVGNLRIEDSDSILYDIKPQTISLSSQGNRVILSTLAFDGDDRLVQEMHMNLTGSGNFYCSEERLGLNAFSMTEPHTNGQVDSFYRDSQI